LTGQPHDIPSLDYEICVDFPRLRDARFAEDTRIVETIDAIVDNGACAGDLSFNSMDGTPRQMPVHLMLSQLFLHAHHRGQVHALLSQTAVAPPALDLTYFPG